MTIRRRDFLNGAALGTRSLGVRAMVDREELRRLYDGELRRHLQALEAERDEARRAWTWFAVTGLAGACLLFALSRLNVNLEAWAFALMLVLAIPLYVFSKRAREAAPRRGAAFRDLVADIAAHVMPGSLYGRPHGSAPIFELVKASGIFNERAEECEVGAAVSGADRPAGLRFAEIRLYSVKEWYDPKYDNNRDSNTTRTPNRREEVDVFRGLFLAFDLGATIRGSTFVDPKRVGAAIADRDALEAVSLADPDFESAWRVTSSEAEEARALLPPSARAGLLRLRELAGRPLHLSISENRVAAAIEFDRPLFGLDSRAGSFERVAEIADLFALAEAAAALPLGVPVAAPSRWAAAPTEAEHAPPRPATSRTRLTRREGGLGILYTRSVSRRALWLSALFAPLLAWVWFLAARELLAPSGDKTGVFAAMIPLSVASAVWLFGAQAWWGPVRRVDVDASEVCVTRGLLRRTRVPSASIQSLAERDGVLRADDLAISPELEGAELKWLAYEVGRALPSATRS
ncbi:MAG TPA: DUF3137 domain-containing protein [Vicinamibacteria bacterium]|nr:DUF3137 domain-containing protein [Vicinamibacteria bacterium]